MWPLQEALTPHLAAAFELARSVQSERTPRVRPGLDSERFPPRFQSLKPLRHGRHAAVHHEAP